MEKQTGFVFFYNKQLLTSTKPVTVSAQNMPLGEFLQLVLKDQPLNYRIEGKTITLSRKPEAVVQEIPKPATPLADSTRTITGVVTSETGEPINAASILVKGLVQGRHYRCQRRIYHTCNRRANPYYFGHRLRANGSAGKKATDHINVKMVLAITSMKDQVVTGIYQRKKESFTGSSTTFTVKELKTVGNQNPLQSLKTLDPSFAIIENSNFGSDPNRLPDIEIRGKSSVIGLTEQYGTNPNQPLFILDGFESTLQVISDFSMDRIESITLLKDAAATAIYGSKAANGVVVVETKRPTPGRLRVNYNLNTTYSFADLSDYNLMNAEEKLEFEKLTGYLGSVNANGDLTTDEGDAKYNARLKEIKRGVNSYWMNEPLRFAFTQRHNLFAEGGDANLRYGVSLSFGENQGIMKNSARKPINGNLRLIYRKGRLSATNSLSIDLVNVTRENVPFRNFPEPILTGENTMRWVTSIKWLKSVTFGGFATPLRSETYYNPLWDLRNKNVSKAESQGFTNNFEIDIPPAERIAGPCKWASIAWPPVMKYSDLLSIRNLPIPTSIVAGLLHRSK